MSNGFLSPIFVHIVFWTLALVVAGATYMYAVSTRRRIVCRGCGERIQTEHDTIQNCPSCGAPLK